jgi:magnesium chelatase family protein
MLSIVKSANLIGINSEKIDVEVDLSNGLPHFEVVGLPDITVKESKDRVRSAIKNSGLEFPMKRIIINLSPANLRKEGSRFDLAIALGLLLCCGMVKKNKVDDFIFIGELSLNGSLKSINGVTAIINSLKREGYNKFIIPKENIYEASIINDVEIYGLDSLKECIDFINGDKEHLPKTDSFEFIEQDSKIDFSDVLGQDIAKRALEIAAAGKHNCILSGPPGCGKTMLAKRIPTILPRLNVDEILEVMQLYSIIGAGDKHIKISNIPPFRNPHHSISVASMVGGGRIPKPGEISLSQNGVLFLDEITEFKPEVLESLRQPLEDKQVVINRLNYKAVYPSDFMLIASMNPCPCGYLGHDKIKCKCTDTQINQYAKKLSGPLLDRIDIQVSMAPLEYNNLLSSEIDNSRNITSETIRNRVITARQIQMERLAKYGGIKVNSQMDIMHIKEYCKLNNSSKKLMKKAFNSLALSMRSYNKILKVARTIADLDQSEAIKQEHLEEAISLRNLNRIENKDV